MSINQQLESWLAETKGEFHRSLQQKNQAGRPLVTLCYAQSIDGSITTRPGETLILSSTEATRMTHQIRSLHDGILVGIGTVLADDPSLTVREWTGDNPQSVVLDSRLRMPATSKLCCCNAEKCWVLTTPEAETPRSDCELIVVPSDQDGHVDLKLALEALYARGITSLMVEGGAAIITAFLRARLADAIVLTIAPTLVGGYKAVSELGLQSPDQLPKISPLFSERLGDELIVWGSLSQA